ncbi:MAG: DNA repair protein RecO [Acidobacteria bacterium]|nr:DNA repair protein RecO [Acidobacteriota bacterium]MCA1608746.1 DNA repair protein RecO [Acidobacteriota bacterium]
MPLIEGEGLVLKTYNLAEADRIVVFYMREHGVVRGVARGVKRLKSRFGSMLEPFTTVNVSYFQKEDRELVSITHVELIRSYFDYAVDPHFLDAFSYAADLLLQFAQPADPDEKMFRMFSACLSAAADDKSDLQALRLYFELWLLRLGGFLPDWTRCENCRTMLPHDDTAFLRGGFHLNCATCSRGGVMRISPAHRELISGAKSLPPSDFIRSADGKAELIRELSNILGRLIAQTLGKQAPTSPPPLAFRNAI